jgi:hypothetical protein
LGRCSVVVQQIPPSKVDRNWTRWLCHLGCSLFDGWLVFVQKKILY